MLQRALRSLGKTRGTCKNVVIEVCERVCFDPPWTGGTLGTGDAPKSQPRGAILFPGCFTISDIKSEVQQNGPTENYTGHVRCPQGEIYGWSFATMNRVYCTNTPYWLTKSFSLG